MKLIRIAARSVAILFFACWCNATQAQHLQVQVTNFMPANGFYLTPFWFGIHDGSFDLFDVGSPASPELENLAENGVISGVAGLFGAAQPGGTQGVLANPAGFPAHR